MASEGKISVKGDELLKKHEEWAKGEGSDASNAGKRREAIGKFAENHGLENKALSQVRAGLKIKNDGKRKDWIRTMHVLLPIAEAEIFSNEPGLPFDQDSDAAADQSNQMAEDHGVGGEPATIPAEEQPEDAETAEFNAEVDDAMGEGDAVEPFDPDAETPIDFGGEDNAA